MNQGVMDFFEFLHFLESFELFDKVKSIEEIYSEIKLEGTCCKGVLKKLKCARRFNDESSRLKRLLDPN